MTQQLATFRFKFPRGTNLSLRAADCKDGIPKLRFSTAAHNQNFSVSSITEEDVAVCVKLAQENKRPEFFYTRIHPGHPFASFGRHYMHYKPAYLKGTSVGELFAEADWKMKSLQVGVQSDAEKKNFKSWCDSTTLNGLETCNEFPAEKDSGQVIMSCESLDISDTDDELLFVGDPKMKITTTRSPAYSSYISEHFDSIAHHDEPTFMKMKEIVKLVYAVEWLIREKGVKFDQEWVQSHCSKPKNKSRNAVKVNLSEEEKAEILEQLKAATNAALTEVDTAADLKLPTTDVSVCCPQVSDEQFIPKFSDSGMEFKFTETIEEPVFKALTGLRLPVVLNITGRFTLDDYDFLYKGLDPKMPVTVDENGLVEPDTDSFNELYAQTMPIPASMVTDSEGEVKDILAGGCTTASIPVHKTVPSTRPVETAIVTASTSRCQKQQKIVCTRSNKTEAPSTNAICKTVSSSQSDSQRMFGMIDNTSSIFSTADGRVAQKRPSLTGAIMIQRLVGGKEVGSPINLNMHLRVPTSKAIISAIENNGACSSMQLPLATS